MMAHGLLVSLWLDVSVFWHLTSAYTVNAACAAPSNMENEQGISDGPECRLHDPLQGILLLQARLPDDYQTCDLAGGRVG